MTTLNDEVRSVVEGFIQSGELFTALDVSNKVKLTCPLARHREVRDEVRNLFGTVISPSGWARTPINVTLSDGTTTEALLYHSLTDSWDLDNKYDMQKRNQAALNPASKAAQALGIQHSTAPVPAPVVATPMPKVTPAVVATALPTKDLWMQMFNTQPSLFPRK